ncbi:hypothetical protein [Streptomyces sp. NBRC 109706]|uniref:AraC-like ligand-binding domain-containing protein n=1 Tax=Streptomyces sp. NBRC 109706 TaxID=1550035 RepID=UPI00131E4907|nr:hypothetical protein [Streptomyces sp. NBRC 109706]
MTSRSLVLTRQRFPDARMFEGGLHYGQLGEVGLSVASYTELRSSRTAKMIRRSDPDACHVSLIASGQQSIEQSGRTAVLGRGDLVVHDTSLPFEATVTSDDGPSRSVVLHVPRRLLPLRPPELTPLLAVRLPTARGVGRLLADSWPAWPPNTTGAPRRRPPGSPARRST